VAGAVITECGHPARARRHWPARRACAPPQRPYARIIIAAVMTKASSHGTQGSGAVGSEIWRRQKQIRCDFDKPSVGNQERKIGNRPCRKGQEVKAASVGGLFHCPRPLLADLQRARSAISVSVATQQQDFCSCIGPALLDLRTISLSVLEFRTAKRWR
jgi:hypothetical protein